MSLRPPPRTDVAYELPSTIKSLNDGWLSTFQTTAAASGLFAVVEVVLLNFIKDPVHYTHPHTRAARQALLVFSYCGLLFSCSATISSLVLTDEFGELPVRASRKSDPIKQGLFDSSSASLLEVYGARRSWRWLMWHWLLSLTAAIACLITQILIYVWIEEPFSVQ
ncbi:hypothetical protein B0F90DRAFT_341033 [Multifurca ochricompacta]|uniref:Uncharacterized protein n=1 Tax=Multifurca ochricompacta TaxID=376703 RepID=A0AAD4LVG0_9AGAM|nr:hypothetical protein B0F90DRAFT_341033 [Multifurca ochricompacta]